MISCDLAGTRSLVTGAASGIGLATATLFARCGSRVALNDLPGNPNLAREVASLRDAGLDVVAAPGDVGDARGCEIMVSAAIDELGGLDHLVNNAGTPATSSPVPPRDLDAIDEDMWLKVLSVNLVGPYRCARAAAAALRQGGGAIVNTCSVAGLTGVGSSTAYAASKAGLINLTQALAKALAPEVRVNAVAPGVVDSPWECRWSDEGNQERLARVPLNRAGEPDDFAESILFLACASYITGHTLVVDGGMTA